MKIRKMIFTSVFALAVVCSFAFRGGPHTVYYPDQITGNTCNSGVIFDDDCSPFNTGAACEVYDPYFQNYTDAYADNFCVYPLYHQ